MTTEEYDALMLEYTRQKLIASLDKLIPIKEEIEKYLQSRQKENEEVKRRATGNRILARERKETVDGEKANELRTANRRKRRKIERAARFLAFIDKREREHRAEHEYGLCVYAQFGDCFEFYRRARSRRFRE